MSAVWRRTGQLIVQGVPFREALAQARSEAEPLDGIDEAAVDELLEQRRQALTPYERLTRHWHP